MTIKSANELKEKITKAQLFYAIHYHEREDNEENRHKLKRCHEYQIKLIKEAKEKLKELGCGSENIFFRIICGKNVLCPKCQEEKEIYEEILK